MTGLVCNYAIARFLPYRETGEFVNVGVVVACPERGTIHVRFENRKQRRITAFFPELDIDVYWDAQKAVQDDLTRLSNTFLELFGQPAFGSAQASQCNAAFREIIRPRESLFRFSEPGTLFAADPESALNDLFARFVERQFAKSREYQEVVMREKLAGLLQQWNLADAYWKDRRIGNDDYHVELPFVHFRTPQIIQKAIKPFDLDRKDPSDIYRHGDSWIAVVRRLKQIDWLPEQFVFTVRTPAANNEKKRHAADDIQDGLRDVGAIVVPFEAKAIRVVAAIPDDVRDTA